MKTLAINPLRNATVAILMSLTSVSQAMISAETDKASKALGANMVSEVTFNEGESTLTEGARTDLDEIINSAKASGIISEVKIAAWADREYPKINKKAKRSDNRLAQARAQTLRDYLSEKQNINTINSYNMTQRPNSLQRFLKTPTADMKATFENTGASPTSTEETGIFNQKSQTSKAVIMVYLK